MAAALLLLIALFSCAPAYAQTGAAEIWGRVASDTGEVLANANLTLTSIDTGAERKTRSDSGGRFAFPAVTAGRYRVTAEHEGFAGRRQDDILLAPDQRLQIDLALRRAPLPETIALNPYPPIAESARTHASAFVAETELEQLPVLGRRYTRLAELAPAVAHDAATGGLSVMNLPSTYNRLVIDGFDLTSSITGEPFGVEGPTRVPFGIGQSSIEGLRVETAGAPAEVGGAAGATFSVVTRSGSNTLRGSAYEFFGDRALNGLRTIDEKAGLDSPPYRSNQFGAVAGGPISKKHDFFFVSYEGLRRATEAVGDQNQDLLLARTDHRYLGQQLTLRYMDQRYEGDVFDVGGTSAQGFQGQLFPPPDSAPLIRNRSAAAALSSAIGGRVVNEARLQYARSNDDAYTRQPLYVPHRFDTDRVQYGDTLSWIVGAHSLKAGGDLLRDTNRMQLLPQLRPIQTVGVDLRQYAAFVQDAWRATSSLTIDAGLRYDQQDFAGLLPRDANNWAPRIGFAYSPGERKQVVRGAYGLFYGSTPAIVAAFPIRYTDLFIDSGFERPRVHQATVGWEVEKYRAGSLGIDYLFARGEHLLRAVNVNDPARARLFRYDSLQSTGESIYNGITLHARARVLQQLFYTVAYTFARSDETPQQTLAVLSGHAFLPRDATLRTRYPGNNDQHQHLVVSAMYDTSLLAVDKHGLAKNLLKDWEYAIVYNWQTGNPYSAFVSGDVNGDLNASNDLAPGTTWNQYRLPYQGSFDPRVTRRFRIGGAGQLALIWEAFNVTNRPNYTAADTTRVVLRRTSSGPAFIGNPQFGAPISQLNGRVMQLAARLTF